MFRATFKIAAALLLFGNASAASAQETPHKLASGPLYGGSTQNSIICYIINVGRDPVTITASSIIGQYIGVISNSGSCGSHTPLQPGQICELGANISGGANACAIEAASVRELRGSAQVRHTDPNGGAATTLVDEEMR